MSNKKISFFKSALSISLILIMLFSLCPISAFAVTDEPYVHEEYYDEWPEVHLSQDGLWHYWVLSDGESIEICCDYNDWDFGIYEGDEADLVIPSTIDGYTVVQIGVSAFDCDFFDYSFLESVIIPDTVKYIGSSAFCGCANLKSITLDNGVEIIGDDAFIFCTSLTSITIPDSVTSIGYSAFNGCSALESVTIPDSITSIGDDAFYGCTALESVTIPDSVTSIGVNAFYNCTALTDIYIPDSVTSLGNNAIPTTATVHTPEGSYAEYWALDKGNPVDNNMEIPTEPEIISGDLDGDGELGNNDYAMVKAYVMCQATLTPEQLALADVNSDGAVDAFDTLKLDLLINAR